MITQANNIKEYGISNILRDTIVVAGSTNNSTAHKLNSQKLFTKPEKGSKFLQNASFPLPDGQKFVAKAMSVVTDIHDVMDEKEFRKLLEHAYFQLKLNDKEYGQLPFALFYYPIKSTNVKHTNDTDADWVEFQYLDKQSMFTRLDSPIVFEEKGNYSFEFITPELTINAIDDTNGKKLGPGVYDANNSPLRTITVMMVGDFERP